MIGDQTQTTTATSNFSNTSSANSSSNYKYNGLVKVPFFQVLYRDLGSLFSYIQITTPPYSIIHHVMTVFRIFQTIGPCIHFCNFLLWPKDTLAGKTSSWISIFFQIVPADYMGIIRNSACIIFLVISISMSIIVLLCCGYYKKKATMPGFWSSLIYIYYSSIPHILHLPIATCICVTVSEIIFLNTSLSIIEIIVFIVCLVMILVQIFFVTLLNEQTIAFKPQSMMTVTPTTWNFQFYISMEVTIVTAFISQASDDAVLYSIVILLSTVFYGLMTRLPFYKGGFASPFVDAIILSIGVYGVIMNLILTAFTALKRDISLLVIFFMVGSFFVVYMIMNIIINNYKLSSLQLLDDILDDPELFDTKVKSIHKAMKLVHFGFLLGHPLCYEFGLSKMIIEKFSELPEAWFCFAKYVVIFPEENQNLEMISLSISRNKVKGRLAKLIKTQCCTILKMRETNISNLLKRKINKITKDVNSAKQKLRHVWDVVIQSNLGEIESATKKAISSINRVDIEFKRLIREYPNNRFVTRPYSRFLQELCANYTEASDMQNKTRLLQRGIAINEDHNHQYGMMIFDKIPTKLKTAKFTATENTDLTLSTGELDIEDNITKECENNQALAHRIMNIRIPGTFNSILLRLMILIFVNIIPFIIMIIFIHVLASMLQRPIVYLRQIAAIRSRFAQIASFSFRIFFNIKGYIPEIEYRNADPQEPIGNTWDINEQMNYILGESTRLAQVLNEYQDIGPNDKYLSHVYNALFTSSIQYHYYTSLKNVTIYNMSFQGIIIDYVVQTTTALNLDINKTDILEASFVLNMVHNTRSVLSILRDEIQNFAYYFEDIETKANAIMIILRIIFLMLIILLSIFTLILEIYWIQKNKIAAYKCSMLLPKSCISQLSKGLRSIKKEGTSQGSSYNNEEINKQEENILKIFSSGGMSSTKYDDFILMIIAVGLILMMEIFVILVISDSALKVTGIFPSNAPHMINIGGAYSSKQAAIYYLDLFTVCDSPGEVKLYTMEEYASFVNESLVLSDDLYESLRYGDDKVVAPFGRFEQSVEASKDVIKCDDPTAYQSTFIEVSNCYNADLVFTSITPFVNYILSPFYRYGKSVDPKNPYVNNMWSTLIFPIFTSFFVPMMNGILPEIHFSISIVLNSLILEVFVLIILSIILEIAILIKIKQIETHIRDVLKLLLHPPSEFILHNSKIMKVLSGNFNGERGDSENRDENFYYNVVENLSEITVGIDQNGVVESMNKQCRKLFNINSHEEYENKLLKDLMCNFTGDVDYVLKYSNALNFEGYNNHSNNNNYNTNLNNSHNKVTGENTSTKGKVSYGADSIEKTAKLLTLNQNNEKSMYLVYGNICCGKLVITFRDITAANRYQTLIREERYKCDKMLSSILPPSLVPRVQAGETNISFAVQSATILFLDIVSFTPWCGSLPADKVMYTLNQMFKKLDSNVAQYPTMMKIKCIGDCYMAAGGVFSEMNQPAEHAKEVVNFGLDAIDRIRDINKELNENLQIRVGVNTGGPIVAGVLGIGKPTFEIIGPAINMAQQMEHHGIPMKVHISRNVYELVYGDSFEISERGNIEVKGRSVVTYIVNKRNHQYQ